MGGGKKKKQKNPHHFVSYPDHHLRHLLEHHAPLLPFRDTLTIAVIPAASSLVAHSAAREYGARHTRVYGRVTRVVRVPCKTTGFELLFFRYNYICIFRIQANRSDESSLARRRGTRKGIGRIDSSTECIVKRRPVSRHLRRRRVI